MAHIQAENLQTVRKMQINNVLNYCQKNTVNKNPCKTNHCIILCFVQNSMASAFVPVDLDKLLDEFEEKEQGELVSSWKRRSMIIMEEQQ